MSRAVGQSPRIFTFGRFILAIHLHGDSHRFIAIAVDLVQELEAELKKQSEQATMKLEQVVRGQFASELNH